MQTGDSSEVHNRASTSASSDAPTIHGQAPLFGDYEAYCFICNKRTNGSLYCSDACRDADALALSPAYPPSAPGSTASRHGRADSSDEWFMQDIPELDIGHSLAFAASKAPSSRSSRRSAATTTDSATTSSSQSSSPILAPSLDEDGDRFIPELADLLPGVRSPRLATQHHHATSRHYNSANVHNGPSKKNGSKSAASTPILGPETHTSANANVSPSLRPVLRYARRAYSTTVRVPAVLNPPTPQTPLVLHQPVTPHHHPQHRGTVSGHLIEVANLNAALNGLGPNSTDVAGTRKSKDGKDSSSRRSAPSSTSTSPLLLPLSPSLAAYYSPSGPLSANPAPNRLPPSSWLLSPALSAYSHSTTQTQKKKNRRSLPAASHSPITPVYANGHADAEVGSIPALPLPSPITSQQPLPNHTHTHALLKTKPISQNPSGATAAQRGGSHSAHPASTTNGTVKYKSVVTPSQLLGGDGLASSDWYPQPWASTSGQRSALNPHGINNGVGPSATKSSQRQQRDTHVRTGSTNVDRRSGSSSKSVFSGSGAGSDEVDAATSVSGSSGSGSEGRTRERVTSSGTIMPWLASGSANGTSKRPLPNPLQLSHPDAHRSLSSKSGSSGSGSSSQAMRPTTSSSTASSSARVHAHSHSHSHSSTTSTSQSLSGKRRSLLGLSSTTGYLSPTTASHMHTPVSTPSVSHVSVEGSFSVAGGSQHASRERTGTLGPGTGGSANGNGEQQFQQGHRRNLSTPLQAFTSPGIPALPPTPARSASRPPLRSRPSTGIVPPPASVSSVNPSVSESVATKVGTEPEGPLYHPTFSSSSSSLGSRSRSRSRSQSHSQSQRVSTSRSRARSRTRGVQPQHLTMTLSRPRGDAARAAQGAEQAQDAKGGDEDVVLDSPLSETRGRGRACARGRGQEAEEPEGLASEASRRRASTSARTTPGGTDGTAPTPGASVSRQGTVRPQHRPTPSDSRVLMGSVRAAAPIPQAHPATSNASSSSGRESSSSSSSSDSSAPSSPQNHRHIRRPSRPIDIPNRSQLRADARTHAPLLSTSQTPLLSSPPLLRSPAGAPAPMRVRRQTEGHPQRFRRDRELSGSRGGFQRSSRSRGRRDVFEDERATGTGRGRSRVPVRTVLAEPRGREGEVRDARAGEERRGRSLIR